MATPTARPAATHRFVENNGDDCPCFVHKQGTFYALHSMDTFVVDATGAVWKFATKNDHGAEIIPLPWWEPPTYGLRTGGFIEPIPAAELHLYATPVTENT